MSLRTEEEPGWQPDDRIGDARITAVLYPGKRSWVVRAVDAAGHAAVLKLLRIAAPGPLDIGRFRHEYELALRFDHPHILRPLGLASERGRVYLRLPDDGAVSLRERLHEGPLTAAEVLAIAAAVADALETIHGRHVVHRDITPGNLLVAAEGPPQAIVKVIDFGIAAEISHERPQLRRPEDLEGTLAYMAPEQTGRMARDVDYRADFYSLGATLFEAAAGRPPFLSADAAAAAHAHLAQIPPSLLEIRPDAFPPLAAIIARLLAKDPEARYQSHYALRRDIAAARALLDGGQPAAGFRAGEDDYVEDLLVSGRLYGRARESDAVAAAFGAAATGPCHLLAVAGYSGIGKSALVAQAQRSLLAQVGDFAAGKFNQFGQHVPYAGFIAALSQRGRQILGLPPAEQAAWVARLGPVLGPNARVLADAVPEFGHLLGGPEGAAALPPLVPLGPAEAENRFLRTMRLAIGALAAEDQPLTLFIDDMQWADTASRRLLRELVFDTTLHHLLLVVAYRDNEVPPGHPFARDLADFAELGERYLRLQIGPLDAADVADLLQDTLRQPAATLRPLAELIHAKTGGNPFFLRRFLEDLHRRGLLTQQAAGPGARRWQWSLEAIAGADVSDNVVTLMISQLRQLPGPTRDAMTTAAFLGASFNLATLATALQRPAEALAGDLAPALAARLLVPATSLYRYAVRGMAAEAADDLYYAFAHDRVQEAAYALVPATARPGLHLSIGRLLAARAGEGSFGFDVVNHLNAGQELITDPAERRRLAAANERASLQARDAAAFDLAADYADAALRDTPPGRWQDDAAGMLGLHVHAARMAYLSGRGERLDALLEAALTHVPEQDTAARARLLEVRIESFYASGRLVDTLDLGLEVLAMIGAELPAPESPQELVALIGATRDDISAMGLEALGALPPMSRAAELQQISISAKMTAAAYIARPQLLPLLTILQLRLMMAHGHVPGALSGYSVFGLMCAEFLGDYRFGYRLGRMSMDLVEKHGWRQVFAHAAFSFNTFLRHWVEPLEATLPGLLDTHHNGLEFGNLRHAGLGLYMHDYHAFLAGRPLALLEPEQAEHAATLQRMRQPVAADYQSVLRALVRELRRPAPAATPFEDETFSARRLDETYQARNDHTGAMFLHAWRGLFSFLDGRFADALADADAATQRFAAGRGMHAVPTVVFYGAVAALRLGVPSPAEALGRAEAAQKRLAVWVDVAPETFGAKQSLLDAEIARARGDDPAAFYLAARRRADGGTLLDAAMAAWLHGLALADTGGDAAAALAEARTLYLQWGATALARRLAAGAGDHPRAAANTLTAGETLHAATAASLIDINSLLKTVQAITEDLALPRLLEHLAQVMAENAGARRAVIVLPVTQPESKGTIWAVECDHHDGRPGEVLAHRPLDASGERLPASLLRTVLATGESALLADAGEPHDWSRDPYFRAAAARSVLCIALRRQGRCVGAVYLENDVAARVFTAARVQFLELLLANVVNAVDSARLLHELTELTASLERRVEERTRQLKENEERLRAILDNAPVPMTVGRRSDGYLLYANAPVAAMTGRPVEEIIGRPAQNFYRRTEDREALLRDYRAQGVINNREICLVAADGSDRWLIVSIVPVRYGDDDADLATMIDITQRKAMENELMRLATTDTLTGVANRRRLLEQVESEVARFRRYGGELALIMIDIDHFKSINDQHGHAAGDEVIRQVAKACQDMVRTEDLVGRLGGEEFAVLVPANGIDAALALAERLRERIAGLTIAAAHGLPPLHVTASFGVSELREEEDSQPLFARADQALYAAKHGGRNRVCRG